MWPLDIYNEPPEDYYMYYQVEHPKIIVSYQVEEPIRIETVNVQVIIACDTTFYMLIRVITLVRLVKISIL